MAGGRLQAEGEPRDEHAVKLVAVTRAAESAVAALGKSPVAVQQLMIFAGRRLEAELGRIRLLGEREVGPWLMTERRRLSAASGCAIADHLERAFPE